MNQVVRERVAAKIAMGKWARLSRKQGHTERIEKEHRSQKFVPAGGIQWAGLGLTPVITVPEMSKLQPVTSENPKPGGNLQNNWSGIFKMVKVMVNSQLVCGSSVFNFKDTWGQDTDHQPQQGWNGPASNWSGAVKVGLSLWRTPLPAHLVWCVENYELMVCSWFTWFYNLILAVTNGIPRKPLNRCMCLGFPEISVSPFHADRLWQRPEGRQDPWVVHQDTLGLPDGCLHFFPS